MGIPIVSLTLLFLTCVELLLQGAEVELKP